MNMVLAGGISVLQLALETLVIVLSLSKETTVACCQQLCQLSIQLLMAYYQDHVLLDTVKDLVVLMANNPECMPALHTQVLPLLINFIVTKSNIVMLTAVSVVKLP